MAVLLPLISIISLKFKICVYLQVSKAPVALPFLLEDASRSQADIDASLATDRPFPAVSQVKK